jgi:hypothetical protein
MQGVPHHAEQSGAFANQYRITGCAECGEGDVVMRKVDEYRRYANEAQECADRSLSEKDRAGWLRIAKGWRSLLREYQDTPEAEFDIVAEARSTGQARSTSMH